MTKKIYLTPEISKEVLMELKNGKKAKEIAEKYKVPKHCIYQLKSRKNNKSELPKLKFKPINIGGKILTIKEKESLSSLENKLEKLTAQNKLLLNLLLTYLL